MECADPAGLSGAGRVPLPAGRGATQQVGPSPKDPGQASVFR